MIKIKNTEQFKKAFEQIALFIDECNLHFNDDGIVIRAFDNAQMLYIEYVLSPDGLEGEENGLVGINVTELNKVIAKLSLNDSISLHIGNSELEMTVLGDYERVYTFPLKEVDEKELQINIDDYPVSVELKTAILKDVFNSSKVVADSIIFDCQHNKIIFKAEGIYGKYKTELPIKNGLAFQTKFSSNHLTNMLRNTDPTINVVIKLSPQQPLYVSYELGNNKLTYFLAHMFV